MAAKMGWIGFQRSPPACLAALVPAENAVHPASGGAEDEHPLHIPGQGHKAPLTADTVDPAQQKLAEAQHRLDDAEHRFRQLLALCVELFAARGLQAMRPRRERRRVLW